MASDSSLQEGRGFCTCWFLSRSLCLRAVNGPGTLQAALSVQLLLRSPTDSLTSGLACREPRPDCHHLLASRSLLTCMVYLLQFLALLPSSIISKEKSNRRLWGEKGNG